jgi:GntR family transcriptional regulator
MKIWISKNSEVPVRDQLIAQITLGIASGDLKIGEKLPSTREIARRCELHANTVSSAYQKLADQNLLEFRKGSGFYVAETAGERIEGGRKLDRMIEEFLASAHSLGFDSEAILSRITKAATATKARHLTLIEPDVDLRAVIVHELSKHFPRTIGTSLDDYLAQTGDGSSILVAMFDEKPKIEEVLRDGQRCVYLKGRSVASAMSGETRPREDELVAVVSGWDGFLTFARIILLAAKVDPGNLIIRSTRDDGWRTAVAGASIVVCDTLTAETLNGTPGVRPFPIVSDESFAELAEIVK